MQPHSSLLSRRRPHDIVDSESIIDRLPQPYRFLNRIVQNDIINPLNIHIEMSAKREEELSKDGWLRNYKTSRCEDKIEFDMRRDLLPLLSASTYEDSIDTPAHKKMLLESVTDSKKSNPKLKLNTKKDSKKVDSTEVVQSVDVSEKLDSIIDTTSFSENMIILMTRFGRLVVLENPYLSHNRECYLCSKLVYRVSINKEDIAVNNSMKISDGKKQTPPSSSGSKTPTSSKKQRVKSAKSKQSVDHSVEEEFINEEYARLVTDLEESSNSKFCISTSANITLVGEKAFVVATSLKGDRSYWIHIVDCAGKSIYNACRGETEKAISDLFISTNAKYLSIAYSDGSVQCINIDSNIQLTGSLEWSMKITPSFSMGFEGNLDRSLTNNISRRANVIHRCSFILRSEAQTMNSLSWTGDIYNEQAIQQNILKDIIVWWHDSKMFLIGTLAAERDEKLVHQLNRVVEVGLDSVHRMLCIGYDNGSLVLWDTSIGAVKGHLTKHNSCITHIRFYKNELVISIAKDNIIFIHNAKDHTLLKQVKYYHDEQSIETISISDQIPTMLVVTKNFVDLIDIWTGCQLGCLESKTFKQVKERKRIQDQNTEKVEVFSNSYLSGDNVTLLRKEEHKRHLPFKSITFYNIANLVTNTTASQSYKQNFESTQSFRVLQVKQQELVEREERRQRMIRNSATQQLLLPSANKSKNHSSIQTKSSLKYSSRLSK